MMFAVKAVEDSCYFFNFQLEEFERMIEKSHKITTTKESILFFFLLEERQVRV